jgi:hypothetical protein
MNVRADDGAEDEGLHEVHRRLPFAGVCGLVDAFAGLAATSLAVGN